MTIEWQFKELIPKNLIKNTQIFSTDPRPGLNPTLKLQYGTCLNAWQQKSVSHKFPFGPDLFSQCSETEGNDLLRIRFRLWKSFGSGSESGSGSGSGQYLAQFSKTKNKKLHKILPFKCQKQLISQKVYL
jgi:hypothetical protein